MKIRALGEGTGNRLALLAVLAVAGWRRGGRAEAVCRGSGTAAGMRRRQQGQFGNLSPRSGSIVFNLNSGEFVVLPPGKTMGPVIR